MRKLSFFKKNNSCVNKKTDIFLQYYRPEIKQHITLITKILYIRKCKGRKLRLLNIIKIH